MPRQLDRAAGVLLGAAAGDALGVPYEFARPPAAGELAEMRGGGLGDYAPGEWSDDTQMAVCIAEVAATGADLTSDDALDAVAEAFLEWYAGRPADIGVQTRRVLSAAVSGTGRAGARLRRVSADLHASTARTAGNGALMRTAVVALPHLGDDGALAEAARRVAELTHADPLAGDACVLWVVAVDRAVREARLDGVHDALALLPTQRRDQWARWVREAESRPASAFSPNGFTVPALQAAYAAVRQTPVDPAVPARHLEAALHAAVRVGDDTDTVAAIAGGLLGARYGASAVPARWRRKVHGWPGRRARDLVRLGVLAARGGRPDEHGWPGCERLDYPDGSTRAVPHPDDPGVLLGGIAALQRGVADAVVSLCRLGQAQVPLAGLAPEDHVEVWLVDRDGANNDLAFVVHDAAEAVRELRAEGKSVLLHCVYAHTRTPVVAAAYGALVTGDPGRDVLKRVCAVLPGARPRDSIAAVLERA